MWLPLSTQHSFPSFSMVTECLFYSGVGAMWPSERLHVPAALEARSGQGDISNESCWEGPWESSIIGRLRESSTFSLPSSLLPYPECRRRNPAVILDHKVTLKVESSAEDQAERERSSTMMTLWGHYTNPGWLTCRHGRVKDTTYLFRSLLLSL